MGGTASAEVLRQECVWYVKDEQSFQYGWSIIEGG